MDSEKFCLRWNDFESNISGAFKNLRDDKDFFDVTLACDDEQLQAHKVILSACSPFFRNVLRRNPHQHPLLYLKGVKYTDLQSVLNFMYHGEVNVAQEELNSFLGVAEDLKVKGLTQTSTNIGQKSIPSQKPQAATKSAHFIPNREKFSTKHFPVLHPSSSVKLDLVNNRDDEDIQEIIPVKSEPRDPAPVCPAPESTYTSIISTETSTAFEEEIYDEVGYFEDQDYQGQQTMDSSQGDLAQLDSKIDSLLGSTESGQLQCLMCGKTSNVRWNIRNHIETHVAKEGFTCDHCGKQYRTRNSLNVHKSKHHKSGQEDNHFRQ